MAVVNLAERVIDDATSIVDVVLAAAARCYFSTTLDARVVGLPIASE